MKKRITNYNNFTSLSKITSARKIKIQLKKRYSAFNLEKLLRVLILSIASLLVQCSEVSSAPDIPASLCYTRGTQIPATHVKIRYAYMTKQHVQYPNISHSREQLV